MSQSHCAQHPVPYPGCPTCPVDFIAQRLADRIRLAAAQDAADWWPVHGGAPVSRLYYDANGKTDIWPKPKVGDQFSITTDIRENWFLEGLRKLRLRRKPRRTITAIQTVMEVSRDEVKLA